MVIQQFLKSDILCHIVLLLIFSTTVCIFLVVFLPQTGTAFLLAASSQLWPGKHVRPSFPLFIFLLKTFGWHFHHGSIQRVNYLLQSFGADQSGACLPGGNSKTQPFYYFFKGQKQRQLLAERVIRITEKCHASGCVIYLSKYGWTVSSWPASLRL